MSRGSQDKKTAEQGAGASEAGNPTPQQPQGLPRKGLGVGLFWSILFMLVSLFGMVGGMGYWMVKAASSQTEAGELPPIE